jgi:murein DD-endopeptidase MepM/ murein hydrolase activator NlpD
MEPKTKRNLLLALLGFFSYKFFSKGKTDLSNYINIPKSINSGFGIRGGLPHRGVDFKATTGTKILLLKKGVVEKINTNCRKTNPRTTSCGGGWGNYITINHGNNIKTRYAHLSKINVVEGEQINYPIIIGETGDTGNSTGPHLHWEYLENNNRVNGTGKQNQYFNLVK